MHLVMNIWQYQNKISRQLLQWGAASVVLGLLLRVGGKFWKGLGGQFVAWGAIDAAIAIFGQMGARDRVDRLENPGTLEIKQQEVQNMSRLLWINAGLDVLYIFGGWLWMRRDKGDGQARGNGFGVMLQGVFLLVFDLFHATNLPKAEDGD